MKVVASLSQGLTAAAQCGLFTHKSVPVIFEPHCILYSSLILILIYCTYKSVAWKLIVVLNRKRRHYFSLYLLNIRNTNNRGKSL